MPSTGFWVWVVAAAVFLIAEIFTSGFFLFPFGIGAAAAAVLHWFGLPVWSQWAAFIVVSAAVTLVARRYAAKSVKSGTATGIDRLIGQKAIVTERIDNAKATGQVRIQHEEWRAWSDGGEPIPAEGQVEVLRIEGNHVVVRRAV